MTVCKARRATSSDCLSGGRPLNRRGAWRPRDRRGRSALRRRTPPRCGCRRRPPAWIRTAPPGSSASALALEGQSQDRDHQFRNRAAILATSRPTRRRAATPRGCGSARLRTLPAKAVSGRGSDAVACRLVVGNLAHGGDGVLQCGGDHLPDRRRPRPEGAGDGGRESWSRRNVLMRHTRPSAAPTMSAPQAESFSFQPLEAAIQVVDALHHCLAPAPRGRRSRGSPRRARRPPPPVRRSSPIHHPARAPHPPCTEMSAPMRASSGSVHEAVLEDGLADHAFARRPGSSAP